MDSVTRSLVRGIHDAPSMAVAVVTGGGALAVSWLLEVPGASRTLLEATVPYSAASLLDLLGYQPDQAASEATARDLARTAFDRAAALGPSGAPVVGIGCTAAIASDRPKRGPHRCHVVAWSSEAATVYSLQLAKDLRDRPGEERVVGKVVLRALADALSVDFDVPLELNEDEHLHVTRSPHQDPVGRLFAGEIRSVTVSERGDTLPDRRARGGVLPGSFNPLHEGHLRLAEAASEILDQPVVFELSILNVDKPPLPEREVRDRLHQLAGRGTMVVTRARVFSEKAALFPGCAFVVGFDTARRLIDPVYYGGSESVMLGALRGIRERGCSFLVAGRDVNGYFQTLADLAVPNGFEGMFEEVPEAKFRIDVSSSDVRTAAAGR